MKRLRHRARSVAFMALAAVLVPLTSAQAAEQMTREKVIRYYQLFNAGDPHYGDLLADDVVFPHITGKTFHGRKEVVDFYQSMRHDGANETREPTTIVIDNAHGLMAVELTVRITPAPGATPTLPTGEVLHQGDVLEGHNTMFYGIKDGKIVSIRGAASGAGKFVLVK